MPCDELTVEICAIFSAKEGCLSKDVLNLCRNLAKLDVFNYRKNTTMFADDTLRESKPSEAGGIQNLRTGS